MALPNQVLQSSLLMRLQKRTNEFSQIIINIRVWARNLTFKRTGLVAHQEEFFCQNQLFVNSWNSRECWYDQLTLSFYMALRMCGNFHDVNDITWPTLLPFHMKELWLKMEITGTHRKGWVDGCVISANEALSVRHGIYHLAFKFKLDCSRTSLGKLLWRQMANTISLRARKARIDFHTNCADVGFGLLCVFPMEKAFSSGESISFVISVLCGFGLFVFRWTRFFAASKGVFGCDLEIEMVFMTTNTLVFR